MSGPAGFFRGSELPRLLVLAAILVGGASLFLFGWQPWRQADAPGQQPLARPPAPVVPDCSEAFEGVRDRTPMRLLDNAALQHLTRQARGLTPEQLASRSRSDVLLTHLVERPEGHRGVPVHLQGTALRVLTYEVAPSIAPSGRLYEAWIVTPDSQKYPYACVFEELPPGFPIGPRVSERVVFNGYFLKLLAYVAGDAPRLAPLLVGRIGWTPPEGGRGGGPASSSSITLMAIAALLAFAAIRWAFQLRRLFGYGRRPAIEPRSETVLDPPADLEAMLAAVPDEEEDLEDDDGPRPRRRKRISPFRGTGPHHQGD